MKLRCLLGHLYEEERRIRGRLLINDVSSRGVYIVRRCSRCGKRRAEFCTLIERTEILVEFVDAYAAQDAAREEAEDEE